MKTKEIFCRECRDGEVVDVPAGPLMLLTQEQIDSILALADQLRAEGFSANEITDMIENYFDRGDANVRLRQIVS